MNKKVKRPGFMEQAEDSHLSDDTEKYLINNFESTTLHDEKIRERSKFSGVYDLAPVGYFILSHLGMIKDVNDTGINFLQNTKANIIGSRLQSFISENNSDEYNRFFMDILKSNEIQRCNLEIKQHPGKTLHIQAAGISRSFENDPAECYIAFIDISHRISAEQELAEIRDRLELSLKASLAGTWELDLKTMSFFLDEGSQRICNVPDSGFKGYFDDFLEMIHPDDRQRVENSFRTSLNNHKEIDLTCRFGKPDDNECYAVIRGHLIPTAEPHRRFVGIILDITEKTQMEKSSAQLKDEYQKKIAAAMMNTEENERKRISGSLHDSVSQLLYGVKIQLGQLEKTGPELSNFSMINKLLDQAIEETRNISFELAPSILTDFGLPSTVEELVRRLSSKSLKMTVKIKGLHQRMDLLLETNIYRIIQELVNNSMKHSGATHIKIEVSKTKFIEIIVEDNGRGYNVAEQERSMSGSGLSSIRNRLSLYNGSMTIESGLEKGTAVRVKLHE